MATIKDNFTQMKNMSELMVDLAYSAVFLRDKKLAEQVLVKYKDMEQLEENTLKLFFRIKIPEEEMVKLVGLMSSIMEIANAARKIADLSDTKHYPPILHDILKDHRIKSVK